MLLLYHIAIPCIPISFIFTFHYASTISNLCLSCFSCPVHLYIPLCFYYIKYSSFWYKNFDETLHSTMLLLYRVSSPAPGSFVRTLHSTMLLLYPPWSRKALDWYYFFTFHYASTISFVKYRVIKIKNLLYIPLCFYYIHTRSRCRHNRFHFTFHYASTISNRGIQSISQDARLYIPLCFYYIQTWFKILVCAFNLYIPLCFYYICLFILMH